MTTPAIAPSERESRCSALASACAPPAIIGVDVTVCVTLAPETVTTRTLVTGDGVAEGVMELLGSSVATGPGAMYRLVVPLKLPTSKLDELVAGAVEVVGAM